MCLHQRHQSHQAQSDVSYKLDGWAIRMYKHISRNIHDRNTQEITDSVKMMSIFPVLLLLVCVCSIIRDAYLLVAASVKKII